MSDLNVSFRLRIKPFTNKPSITIIVWDDMGWDDTGRVRLACEVRQGGKVIFPKGQLYCSLHGASDGNRARELVMSLVAMKPGDTDMEYFEGYTEAQLDWAREYGEALSCEREFRYCDKNGNPKGDR